MDHEDLSAARGAGLSETEAAFLVEAIGRDSDGIEVPSEWAAEDPAPCSAHDAWELRTRETGAPRFAELSPAQQVKAALRGNRRARGRIFAGRDALLLRLVTGNPAITEEEVLALARSPKTSAEGLRHLAENPAWTRIHAIRMALVENPRTPAADALRLLPGLHLQDLRQLARNRNVPVVVATHARRAVERREGRLTQTVRLTRSVSSRDPARRSFG